MSKLRHRRAAIAVVGASREGNCGITVPSLHTEPAKSLDHAVVAAYGAAPGGRRIAGTASVFHGSAMGNTMAPTRVLEGTASFDPFGISVASLRNPRARLLRQLPIDACGYDPRFASAAARTARCISDGFSR